MAPQQSVFFTANMKLKIQRTYIIKLSKYMAIKIEITIMKQKNET
jgi:hypothetical protein